LHATSSSFETFTLSYVNRLGETVTLTTMPPGVEPIEARQILAATTCKVTAYF
jgi:hypothetical protein